MTDDLTAYRLTEKNLLQTQITTYRTKMGRSESAITELKKSSSSVDREYIKKQMNDHNAVINEMREKIDHLTDRLNMLARGELDDEILEKIENNTIVAKRLEEVAHKKKVVKAEIDTANRVISERHHRNEREADYQNRSSNFGMERSYERFRDMEFPRWITDQLRFMPNNKGYIWKDIWVFGQLPPDDGPCVMYENQRSGTTIIHEIYADEHVIYEKVGKDGKEYIDSWPRKPLRRP